MITSYPLVMTQRSENVQKAFVRYSMTGFYIERLYEELPWEEQSAIRTINGYHSGALKKIQQQPWTALKSKADEILKRQEEKVTTLEHLDHVLLENLKLIRQSNAFDFSAYDKYRNADIIFSQFDMAMVQSAFFASLVTFPHLFGLLDVPK